MAGWRVPMATATSIFFVRRRRGGWCLFVARLVRSCCRCAGAGVADWTRRWAARVPRTNHDKTQPEPSAYDDARIVGQGMVVQNGVLGGGATLSAGAGSGLSVSNGDALIFGAGIVGSRLAAATGGALRRGCSGES